MAGNIITDPTSGLSRIFGGGGRGSKGSVRGINVNKPPAQDPYILRPPSTPDSFLIDPTLQQELEYITRQREIDLAQYAQRVAVANAEAAQQRRAVNRDIGIQNQYRGFALDATNAGYEQLIAELQGIHPLTQQAYDTGVTSISDAYNSGVANLAIPPAEDYPEQGPRYENLAANLAALEGVQNQGLVDTSSFVGEINDPLQYMSDLLTASGATGSADLEALGAGDVGAALAALPGYREEQQEELSDINLEVDAALNNLRNELSMITPNFVPFNAAQLELDQQRAMTNALLDAIERRGQDENYQGYRGAQNLAESYGRPDLNEEFFNIMSTANEGLVDPSTGSAVPFEIAVQRAINSYGVKPDGSNRIDPRKAQIDRQILQQLFEAYIGNY